MAHGQQALTRFIEYSATPAWRNAVTLAAVLFALCHITTVLTLPPTLSAPQGMADLGEQVLHVVAELLRFVAPLACMIAGFVGYFRQQRHS